MDAILEQLVEMSRYVGAPGNGYAILGEGNTSARIDKDFFYVKASGTTLRDIEPSGFVKVRARPVLELLDNQEADDATVGAELEKAVTDGPAGKRPSVETMLHAILLQIPEYAFICHAHPVYCNMVLCSRHAEELATGRLFPDHVVSLGIHAVYVPYVDPGLVLARTVRERLHQFVEREGVLPRAIMMQNHGIITMGDSPKAATSCLDMAEKAARILVGTYALGGPCFMEPAQVERIFTRPDEKYRLGAITENKQ